MCLPWTSSVASQTLLRAIKRKEHQPLVGSTHGAWRPCSRPSWAVRLLSHSWVRPGNKTHIQSLALGCLEDYALGPAIQGLQSGGCKYTGWTFPQERVPATQEERKYSTDPGSIPGSGRSAGEGMGYPLQYSWASPVAQLVKNLPARQETWVRSLVWEDSPKEGEGYPLQYSDLENSMDYAVHGVAKSQTWLSEFHSLTLET